MKKIYYYFEGGLGDVIRRYYRHPNLRLLDDFKKQNVSYVRAILNVHNLQTAELFRFHESFDEIQYHSYNRGRRESINQSLQDEGFLEGQALVPSSPESSFMHLSASDNEYLSRILPQEPFIVLQPGSGMPVRSLFNRLNFSRLFSAVRSFGKATVVVGGHSTRTTGPRGTTCIESWDLGCDGGINLVGRANPRLVCAILARSSGFIGTLSCYVWAALAHAKPSTCLIPRQLTSPDIERILQRGVKVHMFDEIRDSDEFYSGIAREVCNEGLPFDPARIGEPP